jgi:pyruvate/2-oxoglutarate dehydrogenase complex dihydrolipoamide acyltransferase (E2) component
MKNAVKLTEELNLIVAELRVNLDEISASVKQTIALTREGEGLVAALLTDRKLKEKMDDMLDQGLYLLEHPVMFILKGGYDKREEKPKAEEARPSEPAPTKSPAPAESPRPKPVLSPEVKN